MCVCTWVCKGVQADVACKDWVLCVNACVSVQRRAVAHLCINMSVQRALAVRVPMGVQRDWAVGIGPYICVCTHVQESRCTCVCGRGCVKG